MAAKQTDTSVTVTKPNMQVANFRIIGNAPYVGHKFSQKALNTMEETQKAGSTAKSKKKREARDFKSDFEGATHVSEDGWFGIPAHSFRNAMIRACTLVGYKMTQARMSVFVEADGLDKDNGDPLVKLEGEREMHVAPVRNSGGTTDLRARPMYRRWSAVVRIRWDTDQFTLTDVANLLMRAGIQVGVGEGRPSSKMSNGLGWGTFDVVADTIEEAAE